MYPRTSSPTAAILLTVVLVFSAMTPVIAADGSSLRSTRNKVHSFIHRKALEGVGESTTEIFTITVTQLPQTSLHDECDPAAVFQRRLAVFYGIPPNRVNIVATDTCRLNFTFVNNSFDGGDYYSNRQLTALLLSLNITYAEQFLFVASLFVSNETSSPSIAPTISPVPRSPPSAQESQSAKKLFLASFTSGSGAASFQKTLAEFLNVDSNRIAWTLESDSARSREHKLTQNILYFSANDNNLLDVADHAEASAASGDS
ncbi:membrane-associated protein, putative, partial [Bodo saltans]